MFQKNFTECLFPPEEVSDQQQMETSIQHNPVDSSGSLKDSENNERKDTSRNSDEEATEEMERTVQV